MIKRFSKWNKSVPNYSELQKMVVECILSKNNEKLSILELGVGKGGTAIEVLNQFPQAVYYGVDNNEKSLKSAEKNLSKFKSVNLDFSQFMDYEARVGSFDVIITVLALHHLLDSEKKVILKRIKKWLKPGGILIIGDLIQLKDESMDARAKSVFNNYRKAVLTKSDMAEMRAHVVKEKSILNNFDEIGEFLTLAGFKKIDIVWCFYRLAVIRAK